MNRFVFGFVCFAVVACAVHAATKRVLSEDLVQSYADAFERYQVKFNKHYASQEERDKRLRAYAASMEEAKELNEKHAGEDVVFGETSRSDVLDEEKKSTVEMIPFDSPKLAGRVYGRNSFPQPALAVDLGHTANNVPTEFNWFNVSGVKHPARNQGQCGSCWAFGGIGALEMQAVLEGHTWYDMSRQQAVDCTTNAHGCCGGWFGYIYEQIASNGYVTEANYPYELAGGYSSCNPTSCRSSGKPTVEWVVNGYDSFSPMNASELKKEIWMYGPVTVTLNAIDGFSSYQSGIFKCTTDESSDPSGLHAVVAVGFGSNYIAIRNSWGTDWGLDGDMRLSTASPVASCLLLKDRGKISYARVSVKPKEQCTSGACCNTTTKRFLKSGTVCRKKNGACDIAEKCTGTSASCPADKFVANGTVCANASGVCENDAVCTGTSGVCPNKTFKSSSTVCRKKNGACDIAEKCTGKSAACPANKFVANGTVCANASGVCENDAVCTGTSGVCPNKTFKSSSTVCRKKNGACDVAEKCTGKSATCPADKNATAGTVCANATGPCENAAKCTGTSKTCPAKTLKANGTVCRAKVGTCDIAETCSGTSVECPADKFVAAGTLCANASGFCENDAKCTGTSGVCPNKTFKPATTVCREKNGTCDVEETCTGSTAACPADKYAEAGTVCNPSSGPCENDGVCSGKSKLCPVNKTLKANGTVCRNATGLCDSVEVCDGISIECPPDEYLPADTICSVKCPDESKSVTSSSDKSSSVKSSDKSDESDLPSTCETYTCMGDSPYCPVEVPISSGWKLNPQYVFAAMVLLLQVMLW